MHKNQHTLLTEVICLSENYATHNITMCNTAVLGFIPSL